MSQDKPWPDAEDAPPDLKPERPVTEGLKLLPASVVEKILKKAAELSKPNNGGAP